MRVVFPFHKTFQTSFGFLENLVVISLKVETGMRSSVEMREVKVKTDSGHSIINAIMLKNSHFFLLECAEIESLHKTWIFLWLRGGATFPYSFLLPPTSTKLSHELNSECCILSRYIFTYFLLFRFWQLGQSELAGNKNSSFSLGQKLTNSLGKYCSSLAKW